MTHFMASFMGIHIYYISQNRNYTFHLHQSSLRNSRHITDINQRPCTITPDKCSSNERSCIIQLFENALLYVILHWISTNATDKTVTDAIHLFSPWQRNNFVVRTLLLSREGSYVDTTFSSINICTRFRFDSCKKVYT